MAIDARTITTGINAFIRTTYECVLEREISDAGVFTDKLSGAQVERPGLKEALSQLRQADTLVVWKLDRLGRSVKGLVDLVNELETQKVHFQSITDGIDTKTPADRFFFHLMASLAQMERELIMERTRAGLQAARRQGRVGGRKRQMTEARLRLQKSY
jgi:DNA invertase Pin-like site-specific DNA recombinase